MILSNPYLENPEWLRLTTRSRRLIISILPLCIIVLVAICYADYSINSSKYSSSSGGLDHVMIPADSLLGSYYTRNTNPIEVIIINMITEQNNSDVVKVRYSYQIGGYRAEGGNGAYHIANRKLILNSLKVDTLIVEREITGQIWLIPQEPKGNTKGRFKKL